MTADRKESAPADLPTPRTDTLCRDICADRYGKPMRAAIQLVDALEREAADLRRQLAEANLRFDSAQLRYCQVSMELTDTSDKFNQAEADARELWELWAELRTMCAAYCSDGRVLEKHRGKYGSKS